jgi:hypothetical protein
MIDGALKIAVLTRLAGKSFNITGHETLGIAPVDDIASPYHGRIPIPPLLDAQIDQIWMGMMMKLRKKVLSELRAKIMSRDKKLWYEIFLTILVLLVNLEFMYQNQNRQLQRYCMEVGQHAPRAHLSSLTLLKEASLVVSIRTVVNDAELGVFRGQPIGAFPCRLSGAYSSHSGLER